jgi:hypothetical protein
VFSSLKYDEMINYWLSRVWYDIYFGPQLIASDDATTSRGSIMDKSIRPFGHKTTPKSVFSHLFLAASILALASGCASRSPVEPETGTSQQSTTGQMQGAASNAASQPLRDIGLMKKKIPYALTRIADPYAEPSGPGCVWITYELTQLSAALGPEVAVMPVADRSSARERGSRMAVRTAREMISSAGSRLLPGRSVIRTLSGARNADELYEAAQQRGMVRRGYLKGLSEARNCAT